MNVSVPVREVQSGERLSIRKLQGFLKSDFGLFSVYDFNVPLIGGKIVD